jgi:hypothetical protein
MFSSVLLSQIKEELEKFFYNKLTIPYENFKFHAEKSSGSCPGFQMQDKDNNLYLVKPTSLKLEDCKEGLRGTRRDWLHEFLFAPFYKRFLYHQSAFISLNIDCSNEKIIYLRSHFIPGFRTIAEVIKSKEIDKLKNAAGFEKIVAVNMFLANFGYHEYNLGVVEKDGKLELAEVDYGRSGYYFDNSISEFLERIVNGAQYYKYDSYFSFRLDLFLCCSKAN